MKEKKRGIEASGHARAHLLASDPLLGALLLPFLFCLWFPNWMRNIYEWYSYVVQRKMQRLTSNFTSCSPLATRASPFTSKPASSAISSNFITRANFSQNITN